MSEDDGPLSSEERAELEELRAERARRQQAERDRAEREELERLRSERDASQAQVPADQAKVRRTRRVRTVTPEEAAQIEHDKQVRARNARLMEPDDDLAMPIGQKIALVGIFAFAIIAVLAIVFGPK